MKKLTVLFKEEKDTVNVSIEKSNETYTPYELYMAYKYIEAILNASEFDWSKVSDINAVVLNKEDK